MGSPSKPSKQRSLAKEGRRRKPDQYLTFPILTRTDRFGHVTEGPTSFTPRLLSAKRLRQSALWQHRTESHRRWQAGRMLKAIKKHAGEAS